MSRTINDSEGFVDANVIAARFTRHSSFSTSSSFLRVLSKMTKSLDLFPMCSRNDVSVSRKNGNLLSTIARGFHRACRHFSYSDFSTASRLPPPPGGGASGKGNRVFFLFLAGRNLKRKNRTIRFRICRYTDITKIRSRKNTRAEKYLHGVYGRIIAGVLSRTRVGYPWQINIGREVGQFVVSIDFHNGLLQRKR